MSHPIRGRVAKKKPGVAAGLSGLGRAIGRAELGFG
jgi:hypothetical protein